MQVCEVHSYAYPCPSVLKGTLAFIYRRGTTFSATSVLPFFFLSFSFVHFLCSFTFAIYLQNYLFIPYAGDSASCKRAPLTPPLRLYATTSASNSHDIYYTEPSFFLSYFVYEQLGTMLKVRAKRGPLDGDLRAKCAKACYTIVQNCSVIFNSSAKLILLVV